MLHKMFTRAKYNGIKVKLNGLTEVNRAKEIQESKEGECYEQDEKNRAKLAGETLKCVN